MPRWLALAHCVLQLQRGCAAQCCNWGLDLACCVASHLYRIRACDDEWVTAVPSIKQTCVNQAQLFLIPKRLFHFRNVIPTLEIQTQKCLGTCFYIVEMLQVCNDKAHIGCSTCATTRPRRKDASRLHTAFEDIKMECFIFPKNNKNVTMVFH